MKLSVALVQLDATVDVERSIAATVALADKAAEGARLVALPEYLQFRGPDSGFRASARPISGPHTDPFAEVARRRDVWILLGSAAETSADPTRPYNTSTLIAPDGTIVATHRKIHLFDVAVDRGPVDTESARVTPGDRVVTAAGDGTVIGLSICYDLRFPELYRSLVVAGAQILTVPANFTERTGRDHWEMLLRVERSRTVPTSWRPPRSADHRDHPGSGARWSSTRGARSWRRRRTGSGSSARNWISTVSMRSVGRFLQRYVGNAIHLLVAEWSST